MTTDLRTEQDVRAALDLLSSDAPAPASVLTRMQSATAENRTPCRRWTIRLLPVAAVLAIAGFAAGLAFVRSAPPADDIHPSGPNDVVGVWWQLEQVNGQRQGTGGASLDIAVLGTFRQALGTCDSLVGRITITASVLHLSRPRREIASCLAARGEPGPNVVADLRRLLRGNVAWSVSANTLTLHGAGVTATYTPHPGSGTPSRQWVYRGVGISVPARWPGNASRCAAPKGSVIYSPVASTCTAVGDKHATTVQFTPLAATRDRTTTPIEIDGIPATEGFHQLPDGRNLAQVRIHSHNVSVTITSPDAALVAHLAEFEIYIAQ